MKNFLEPSRLRNLITYLEKLHEKGVADKDHTTLLLGSYVHLKDENSINNFVNNDRKALYTYNDSGTNGGSTSEEISDFDTDAAINILIDGGYLGTPCYYD